VANQPVTITTNVVNEGDITGITKVALKINGQVDQTKLVTVSPGVSGPVTFTVTRAEMAPTPLSWARRGLASW